MPDVAGESVLEEVDHPRSYPVIRSLLTKGAATMILVDAADVASGRQHQDFFAMKILTYLSELDEQRKRRRRSRPVAVVFTKADECPRCFEDPEEFARHRTPGLYKQCRQQFRRHAFFAVGVAGACGQRSDRYQGTVRVPLRIEPRGVVEPFEWVVGQVKRF